MGTKFNPLLFLGLDITGSGGSSNPYFGNPVDTESLLPSTGLDGEMRVTKDTDHVYIWDNTSSQWKDSGITSAVFGSTANANGYSLVSEDVGNIRYTRFVLQPADSSNPGAISTTAQNIPGDKIFDGNTTFTGTISKAGLNNNRVIVSSGGQLIENPALTANRALTSSASGLPTASAVSSTELSFVAGVTSSIQTQLNSKIPLAEKGAANGVAPLDGASKIDVAYLPNSIMQYVGLWNASTNTPTLADGAGNPDISIGDVYRVSVAGTRNLGSGSQTFDVGDYVILNDSKVWEKADTTDSVVSVNGQTGVVVLTTTNIPEGTNLYFTDERAQDAFGSALTDTSTIDLTYSDSLNQISAIVVANSLTNSHVASGANIDATKLGTGIVSNTEFNHLDGVTSAIQTQLNGKEPTIVTLPISKGGTNLSTTPSDGQLLIGNGTDYTLNTLTAGTGIAIVNSSGSITVESSSVNINDIFSGSFSGIENANDKTVDNLNFATGAVRSFEATVTIIVTADTNLYESYNLKGIQSDSDWFFSQTSFGDDSGVFFSIQNDGQINYTSTTYSGFVSLTFKFKANTLLL
jgi:hypothetical protein